MKPHHTALAALIWTAGRIYVPKARAIAARKSGAAPSQGPVQGPAQTGMPDVASYSEASAAQPGQWFNLDGTLPN